MANLAKDAYNSDTFKMTALNRLAPEKQRDRMALVHIAGCGALATYLGR